MASLYNLDYEASSLAILLKNPEVYAEVDFLTSRDYSKVNSPVFSVIVNLIENKSRPEPLIVAERLKALGISMDGISGFDYVSSLALRPVDKRSIMDIAKELKKKTLIRTICNNADSLKKEVLASESKSGRELIGLADKYLGESLVSLSTNEREPQNLLEQIPGIIEELGNDDKKSDYIWTPYETWNKVIGPFRPGQLYFFCARQGSKKSTLLLDIARETPSFNPDKEDMATLVLDTEMLVGDAAVRYVAGKIGCPPFLIDSRKWRYDAYWCPRIKEELARIENLKHKNIWFESIGNMGMSEMERFIKRWKLTKVGRDRPCMIIYDYLKINNKDKSESSSNKEYEQAYSKLETIKDLAEWCHAPVISAIQANKAGDVYSKNGPDDSSAATSVSDRIGWLVAAMAILRVRTPDETNADSAPGMLAPTNKMIFQKTRYLWEHGPAFLDYIKVKDGKDWKYVQNYINFDIRNFSVKDCGTYTELLERLGKVAQKLPAKSNELFL